MTLNVGDPTESILANFALLTEVNMANLTKLLGLDKFVTLFRTIRDHGGIISSFKTLYRLLSNYTLY